MNKKANSFIFSLTNTCISLGTCFFKNLVACDGICIPQKKNYVFLLGNNKKEKARKIGK